MPLDLRALRQSRFHPYLVSYAQHMRRRGLSEATRKVYHVILKGFVGENEWTESTTEEIEAWLDSRHLTPKARRCYIACLAGFYAWESTIYPHISDPTLALVRPKVGKRYPRPVETEALAKALVGANVRMTCWLSLAAFAGFRCKEIAGLQVDDIRLDVDPPVFHLRDTKGDKDRVIPIADEVLEALGAYTMPASGYVFPALDRSGTPSRRKLSARAVSMEINNYLHGMGIPATAHQLRHWFGTELYRKTLNPLLVRDLMGHSDLATTSLYMALVPTVEATNAVKQLTAHLDSKLTSDAENPGT